MTSNVKYEPQDADIKGATAALQRAAQRARELAVQTGTPCYVMRAGRIVDAVTGQEAKFPSSRPAA